MKTYNLDTIQKVPLREVWPHEAHDFTKWLAEEPNLAPLGKVITYAAGKGAEVVIWVVAHARDEHRQAIEWLNQHTDSDFGFLLFVVDD